MYNPNKAKQTVYWIVLGLVTMLALAAIAYPGKILADYDEPQLFINYAELRKQNVKEPEKVTPKPVLPKPSKRIVSSKEKGIQGTKPRPTPRSEQPSGRHYSKDEVIELIKQYSQQYRINPATPLCIAQKESGYNQFSANKSSSARGVFQYLSGTWKATDEGRAGLSVFDAEANVRAAVKYMGVHRSTKPWVVNKNCPPLQFL